MSRAALAALLAAGLTLPTVNISALLSSDTAHVVVRFSLEGEEVQITLRGEEGLAVLGDKTPVRGRSVAKGERIALDVAFERGPAQSGLTVEVTGKFRGETKTESRTFRTGSPSDEQRHKTRERATAPLQRN